MRFGGGGRRAWSYTIPGLQLYKHFILVVSTHSVFMTPATASPDQRDDQDSRLVTFITRSKTIVVTGPGGRIPSSSSSHTRQSPSLSAWPEFINVYGAQPDGAVPKQTLQLLFAPSRRRHCGSIPGTRARILAAQRSLSGRTNDNDTTDTCTFAMPGCAVATGEAEPFLRGAGAADDMLARRGKKKKKKKKRSRWCAYT
jgi:hypothetical protein